MKKQTAIIVLAAGKSTRMKSEKPKVLHPLCGRPVLSYVCDLVKGLKPDRAVFVLGHKHEQIRPLIPQGMKVVLQRRMCGTADAVKAAFSALRGFSGEVVVLYGDTPLLQKETINKLLKHHRAHRFAVTLLTAKPAQPKGYGRILRDKLYGICGIAEEKDATDFQRNIKEVNTGIMCFSRAALTSVLKKIRPNNRKKEYYLTDAVHLLYKKGELIGNIGIGDVSETLGINSRDELSIAHRVMHKRITTALMKEGVTIIDPASVYIAYGVRIGPDTTVYPFTVIEGNVTVGRRASIGPFAHVRAGSRIKEGSCVGRAHDG
ncbi:MAG: NTP transferase domain-containing protein [Candidatus Omnitrophica bacterium]|nr:NTP transferase domain-containing protein [Candidatus Omnitrophota bacterium]